MERQLGWYILALSFSILLNIVLFHQMMKQYDIRLTELFLLKAQLAFSGGPTVLQASNRVTMKINLPGSTTEHNAAKENGTCGTYTTLHPSTDYPHWNFNSTAADQFRDELEEKTKTQEIFVLTQKNVEMNSSLKYQAEKSYFNITQVLYSWLPTGEPFGFKKYKTCSVVGNGGILFNSSCGQQIDSADFVIRMNLPQMKNYTNDVGKRTDLVTANPTILRDRFNSLRSDADREAFLAYTRYFQHAYIYFSAFTYRFCAKLSFGAYKTMKNAKEKTTHATVIFGHPQHLDLATKFWKGKYKIKEKRLTSGLFVAGTALSLCEETRLYGFWPFEHDRQGHVLTHHYYDNVTMPAGHRKVHHHSIPEEFAVLRGLHDRGVLHMTTDKCSDK